MTDFKFYPQIVVWEITFACNMRCLHCGTAAGKKRPDELTTDEALNLIDELAALGCESLILSGGEPFLRPDWRQLAERTVKDGIKCGIISNGYAITKEIVDDMERLKIGKVGISFDGSEKIHNHIRQRDDSWKKAYESMKMMSENGHVKFVAVSQISNINLDDMDEIHKALLDVGCKEWRIQMTTNTGRMMEHNNLVLTLDKYPQLIDKILEIKKDKRMYVDVGENIGYYGCKGYELLDGGIYCGCYAGMRVLGIESNGSIKGCLSMPEQFVEGNIRDSSLTEIWNNPDGFAYNRKFTRESAAGECYNCKYLPICRGGCATTSVSATGHRANNPYCIYQMEMKQGITCEDSPRVLELLEPFKEAMLEPDRAGI